MDPAGAAGPWRDAAVALDAAWMPHAAPALVAHRRAERLDALMAAARAVPLYRERFARHGEAFEAQPALDKAAWMARFDDAVADRRLTRRALDRHVGDTQAIGRPFEGDYTVWESSGSSGVPGLFVQDAAAMAVYDALEALRRPPSLRRWLDPWFAAERLAFVGATGGHYASIVSLRRLARRQPAFAARLRCISFLLPLAEIVAQLGQWQPTVLATYPSVALMLAEQAADGRLRLSPAEVWTGGEPLGAGARAQIGRAFGCPVIDSYGASEFLALAGECAHGRLHLNADWAILEPVDARGRPVPAGREPHTTLLTNLANHVQPLIRYDLGDRVRFDPMPCACGSSLPAISWPGAPTTRCAWRARAASSRWRRWRSPPCWRTAPACTTSSSCRPASAACAWCCRARATRRAARTSGGCWPSTCADRGSSA